MSSQQAPAQAELEALSNLLRPELHSLITNINSLAGRTQVRQDHIAIVALSEQANRLLRMLD